MSSVILEAHDLTKEYRHTVALDHIDLKIEKGKIYGFIGQNGAGKTTFLRLVTGLAFPTSGTLSLWGKTVEKELQEQRKRIGCMIETPALFPTMTAYQNMEIQRIQRGIPDKAVIQKTLDMVGLKDTGKKAVRNFSLGMRQRLGIAIALLNTPEFLILDEPINGLDPAGIVEIRNLLKSLNKEYGMTILVSSHILEELYQTASEFILIDKGKIIEEISDRELNDRCKRHIAIKAIEIMKKMLVVYYSWSNGNTKRIAEQLTNGTGADIARIETAEPYSGSHEDVVEQGKREVEAGFMPQINPISVNLADYDVIAIGTPTWWYTMAPAVLTFLTTNDFTGKTVIPFMTNGGWPGHVIKDMKENCKGAAFAHEMQIQFDSKGKDHLETSEEVITEWIGQINTDINK